MPITSTAACHGPVPWTSRGRSGARWGDHLDAAPRSAWPGRVMIAKLVDPYAAAVNEVSLGKNWAVLHSDFLARVSHPTERASGRRASDLSPAMHSVPTR